MEASKERIYSLALAHTPGLRPHQARALVKYFGSATAVFELGLGDLGALPFLKRGSRAIRALLALEGMPIAERQELWLARQEVEVLRFDDMAYPSRFRQWEQAPFLLYYRGRSGLVQALRSLAMVGTRQPSPYGLKACDYLIEDLLCFAPLWISGLAYGIDAQAHEQALLQGLPTLAIVAHGLDRVYPAAHRVLLQRILDRGGGVLSEFPIKTPALREHFPMRNRLIAGLSDGLILIESALNSGSMISAKQALACGKPVFALPGRIFDKHSEGCHELLAQGQARLLRSGQDVAGALNWGQTQQNPSQQMDLMAGLSPLGQALIQHLQQTEIQSLEQLYLTFEVEPAKLHALLLELEIQGLIKALPAKNYRVH